MGCVSSKNDINDIHPNRFQVSNIDERGNKLNSGQLEVTETDLVLYPRGKPPIKWPLRSLRRYGFDSELFSFESGRRCTTGPGVYAFRCNRAEQLFNILQTHIQMRNNSTDDTVSRDFAPPLPPSARHNGAVGVSVDGNYLEPTPFCQTTTGHRFSMVNGPARMNSIGSSNGPLSPQGTGSPSPPPVAGNNYANEEVFVKTDLDKHRSLSHSYSNTNSLSLSVPLENAPDLVQQTNGVLDKSPSGVPLSPTGSVASASDCNHIRLDDSNCGAFDDGQEAVPSTPVYMNVVPRLDGVSNDRARARRSTLRDSCSDEPLHCYENLEPGELERLTRTVTVRADRPMPLTMPLHSTTGSMSQPVTPVTTTPVINYIVLDLEQVAPRSDVPPSPLAATSSSSFTLDLPTSKPSERYATIDFNRTEAIELLNSAIPGAEPDTEGSRKTRHNSTIPADFPPPITASGSSSSRYSGTPNE